MKQKVHLICNAHLDPVWQWEWEEGAAAAVSTFRAAADFCEEFDDFIFCHNEVTLYQWVEEYEPPLFRRIQELVKKGKWHIMGGWYLQPDCNIPSGESIIRQIRLGQEYFMEKFGAKAEVAINFDPFGHSRGMVQIMAKAGWTGYLFMRPIEMALPSNDFRWVGFDGSEILGHRLDTSYKCLMGEAREKAETWLSEHGDLELGMITWGVGNHGGGPSRKDIADLNELKAGLTDVEMFHSTPEAYFEDLAKVRDTLPKVDYALRPWAVGCYTSIIRIKQTHRRLEGMLSVTERMCSHAAMLGLMEYPAADFKEVEKDLCFAQFHDIIPGSSIQAVEDMALRQMDHALEILSRLRARAFFYLAADEKRAVPEEIPILAYNPHPYPIEGDYFCEFMLADQNWNPEFTVPRVYDTDGNEVPSQVEKEDSNINLDWRKRMVFHTTLAPMSITRFDCRMKITPAKPVPTCKGDDEAFIFENGTLFAKVGKKTGLLESYRVDGREYLSAPACNPVLYADNEDPWGMLFNSFPKAEEAFRLMTAEETAAFCGIHTSSLEPVHVIESGDVRTVLEACFRCRDSYIVTQYVLPNRGMEVEVRVRVLFAEKDKMLKLAFPTNMKKQCLGQTMFGTDELCTDGTENVAQRWVAAADDEYAFTVSNNGVYGSDFTDGEIRMSLLRSAAYTAHPIEGREMLPQDRFTARIDQGERMYTFRLCGGKREERIAHVTREADFLNEPPFVLSFFPNGEKKEERRPMASVSGDTVEMTGFRRAADGKGWIFRLFAPTGKPETATVTMASGLRLEVNLGAYEVRTFRYCDKTDTVTEDSILA